MKTNIGVVDPGGNHLSTLRNCGGYYACPKGPDGKRLGLLVGYAGKYKEGDGEKQYVGDVYYNFAAAETYPMVMDMYAHELAERIRQNYPGGIDCVVGMPMGGIVIATMVATILRVRFAFAEKKITALATATEREKSELVLDRHEIEPGSRVITAEDVCNNFSTVDKAKALIADKGSVVVGLACLLNRSSELLHGDLPVVSMLHIPTVQYRQDDPAVADDIAAGNVILKPKGKWQVLADAMAKAEAGK